MMIICIEIIDQLLSGQYYEKIYDIDSIWINSNWTYINFTDHNSYEWVGHFRGAPKNVVFSEKNRTAIILTL